GCWSPCAFWGGGGKRPSPYTDTPPFSLTFRLTLRPRWLLRRSFSALSRSSSALRSSSDIGSLRKSNRGARRDRREKTSLRALRSLRLPLGTHTPGYCFCCELLVTVRSLTV